MSFVGGKLKLKGSDGPKASGGVKKKKKEEKSLAAAAAPEKADEKDASAEKTRRAIHGYELEQDTTEDRRTEAEKKFDSRFRKVEEQMLKKAAHKSHRDRVKDFNEYLAKLSEHHDIPKVGPG